MNKKFKTIDIKAREILDNRGCPTVEVDLETNFGIFRSSCPAGLSRGEDEAVFIRKMNKYFGYLSVDHVVKNAIRIGKIIIKKNPKDIYEVDKILREEDGTDNFSNIGVNSSLPLSISYLRFFS